jgi:hypothetical protein
VQNALCKVEKNEMKKHFQKNKIIMKWNEMKWNEMKTHRMQILAYYFTRGTILYFVSRKLV